MNRLDSSLSIGAVRGIRLEKYHPQPSCFDRPAAPTPGTHYDIHIHKFPREHLRTLISCIPDEELLVNRDELLDWMHMDYCAIKFNTALQSHFLHLELNRSNENNEIKIPINEDSSGCLPDIILQALNCNSYNAVEEFLSTEQLDTTLERLDFILYHKHTRCLEFEQS